MHLKILSVKWWPFCPGGDELSWILVALSDRSRKVEWSLFVTKWDHLECKLATSGGRLNIKMSSYQHRDSHVKELSLTWETPYLGKTVFIL